MSSPHELRLPVALPTKIGATQKIATMRLHLPSSRCRARGGLLRADERARTVDLLHGKPCRPERPATTDGY